MAQNRTTGSETQETQFEFDISNTQSGYETDHSCDCLYQPNSGYASPTEYAINAITEEEVTQESLDDLIAKLPKEYHQFKELFEPLSKNQKPFPKEFFMEIPLKPDTPLPRPAKPYSLSPLDQEILNKFIDEGL